MCNLQDLDFLVVRCPPHEFEVDAKCMLVDWLVNPRLWFWAAQCRDKLRHMTRVSPEPALLVVSRGFANQAPEVFPTDDRNALGDMCVFSLLLMLWANRNNKYPVTPGLLRACTPTLLGGDLFSACWLGLAESEALPVLPDGQFLSYGVSNKPVCTTGQMRTFFNTPLTLGATGLWLLSVAGMMTEE